MFKKQNRVSSWLFGTIMKSKTYFSPSFRVKYKKKTKYPAISVVIPKKIIKKRVLRNSLKRKVLAYLKSHIDLQQNFYCVFWLTKDITDDVSWKNELDELLINMKIKKQ
ncbi:MAG: ribonuclease P protein component [Candidatus Pacebacteria bacterium]|nr:ribonuclease P protein component [Candidatus Paceibacterota bacterium]